MRTITFPRLYWIKIFLIGIFITVIGVMILGAIKDPEGFSQAMLGINCPPGQTPTATEVTSGYVNGNMVRMTKYVCK